MRIDGLNLHAAFGNEIVRQPADVSDTFSSREAVMNAVIDVRHLVLRQGLPRAEAMFEGDDLPTSLHVLATIDHSPAGCATYHADAWNDAPAWRLRGMATHPAFQRRGVGKAVLDFAEELLLARNFSNQLWCNARLIAVPFYESLGWTIESGLFDIPTAGPHHKMAKDMRRK